MTEGTRVYKVIRQNGNDKLSTEGWGDPYAPLLEVAEGTHQGKRGPDYQLNTLVGPIVLDTDYVVIYETGKLRDVRLNANVS